MIDLDDLRWRLIDALEELQQGRCGICERGDSWTPLHLDHDHDSGMIRGFLCRGCNLAEGKHSRWCTDSPCAICAWRSAPATARLGWTVAFVAEWTLTRPLPTLEVAS